MESINSVEGKRQDDEQRFETIIQEQIISLRHKFRSSSPSSSHFYGNISCPNSTYKVTASSSSSSEAKSHTLWRCHNHLLNGHHYYVIFSKRNPKKKENTKDNQNLGEQSFSGVFYLHFNVFFLSSNPQLFPGFLMEQKMERKNTWIIFKRKIEPQK